MVTDTDCPAGREYRMSGDPAICDRWDELMYQLSALPRRQIVVSLMEAEADEALALPGAAKTSGADVDPDRFEIKIRQIHLPMLANVDYIQWTADPFHVRRGQRFDEPASVMRALLDEDAQLAPTLLSDSLEKSP